jgi:hypothetical protein
MYENLFIFIFLIIWAVCLSGTVVNKQERSSARCSAECRASCPLQVGPFSVDKVRSKYG